MDSEEYGGPLRQDARADTYEQKHDGGAAGRRPEESRQLRRMDGVVVVVGEDEVWRALVCEVMQLRGAPGVAERRWRLMSCICPIRPA
jgi:hypothetical protein